MRYALSSSSIRPISGKVLFAGNLIENMVDHFTMPLYPLIREANPLSLFANDGYKHVIIIGSEIELMTTGHKFEGKINLD